MLSLKTLVLETASSNPPHFHQPMAPKKVSQKKKETITELPGGAIQTRFSIGRYHLLSNLTFEFWAKSLLAQSNDLDTKSQTHKQKAPVGEATMHGV